MGPRVRIAPASSCSNGFAGPAFDSHRVEALDDIGNFVRQEMPGLGVSGSCNNESKANAQSPNRRQALVDPRCRVSLPHWDLLVPLNRFPAQL
jgi:hypothetical protein